MLVKQRMHSEGWSQKPFVFAPASRFASLEGKWPKPSVPRDIMNFDQVKELEKTMEKIIAEPWNLQSAASYLSALIKSSGTVPTPAKQQPLLQCLPGKSVSQVQQIEPDRVPPSQFLPATCHRVTMKSTAAKSKSKKQEQPTAASAAAVEIDMAMAEELPSESEQQSPDLPPDEDEAPDEPVVAKTPCRSGPGHETPCCCSIGFC